MLKKDSHFFAFYFLSLSIFLSNMFVSSVCRSPFHPSPIYTRLSGNTAGYLAFSLKHRGTSPWIQDIANDGISVRKQSRALSGKLAMVGGATVALHYTDTHLPPQPLPWHPLTRSNPLNLVQTMHALPALHVYIAERNVDYYKNFPEMSWFSFFFFSLSLTSSPYYL